jgi:hypothetical protein
VIVSSVARWVGRGWVGHRRRGGRWLFEAILNELGSTRFLLASFLLNSVGIIRDQ